MLFRSTSATDSAVTLVWAAPLNSGGAPITGYAIEQSVTSGVWTTAVGNTNSSVTTYQVTGLTNGTAYQFRVRAITIAGSGSASIGLSATPFAAPSAVQNVRVVGGNGSVQLLWDKPASTGGAALSSYLVERSLNGILWTNPVNVTDSLTAVTDISYTYNGLANGQIYYFRVTAINSASLSSVGIGRAHV